jgi:hypothetical protein
LKSVTVLRGFVTPGQVRESTLPLYWLWLLERNEA